MYFSSLCMCVYKYNPCVTVRCRHDICVCVFVCMHDTTCSFSSALPSVGHSSAERGTAVGVK